jgi:uncharacterized membrane protein
MLQYSASASGQVKGRRSMTEQNESSGPGKKTYEFKPFVAPCRDLHPTAPLTWLRLGWQDFRQAPLVSLAWGLISLLIFALVAWGAWSMGRWVLLLSVLSGFIFIAPLMAFALYSVSRQHDLGQKANFGQTLHAARKPFSNALVFALVLLIVFLLWARAGSMVHIFFPSETDSGWGNLLTFLLVGSAVGSVFAFVAFSASAFSLPFIANREVDVVTAVVSSINAVLRNKWTMFFWAALIGFFTGVGLLTALLGFVIVIPWLGYATWHGYRAALDVSGWPVLPALRHTEE